MQRHLEQVVVDFVQYWRDKTQKSDLILSGGVFSNVKLNQRIAESPGVGSVFIYPNMGDGGLSYGAAAIAHHRVLGEQPVRRKLRHVYLGPCSDEQAIKYALANHGDALEVARPAQFAEEVAAEIDRGKIVGWHQGAMEFGPRALGHRSILARPQDRSINKSLNERLSRTEFMPFAPSCLIEAANEIFNIKNQFLIHLA